MAGSYEARGPLRIERSGPLGAVPLQSILYTEELHGRSSRPADYEKENRALLKLIGVLADSPGTILQALADTILQITRSDSAGLSLLTVDGSTPDARGRRFYWPAIAGAWTPHTGGGTPRDFGPCGDVLDQNRTLLFRHFERRYPYLQPIVPAAEECLLVPFYIDGKAVGTIWAIMHTDLRRFDAEDARVMASLGRFASSAYQAVTSIDELRFQIRERENAKGALRTLADGLEMQVRARTRDLERSTRSLLAANSRLEREIAERKRAEEGLRRSEAFLAEAQHLSLTGSFSWRVATDEVTWSEQLYRIYELDVGVPVTVDLLRTRVHPEDVSLLEQMRMEAQAGGDTSNFEWHYRLLMPDQSIRYLHAVGHATRDEHGQLEYFAAVQDVTARRVSEEALGNARAELAHVAKVMSLGTLAAAIAHELNQPLSGIVTNASTCLRMLAADSPNIEGARETARRMIRDGNRSAEVIARLRALFSRKESTIELIDLNEATREVIALTSRDLERSRVVLRAHLSDDLPLVEGDRVQLQQVILNLLLNASEAMRGIEGRPRYLVITTARDQGDQVRVAVRDVGTGFDVERVDRLFETFYTTKSSGMGIGLSVSRSIVEMHHGRLWGELNDGPGATFCFSIPSHAPVACPP